ncbi:MAG: hypothetical protein ACOX4P_05910 [Anaerovoracaceae bacterium]
MYRSGILHTEEARQSKKSRRLATLTTLVGAAAGLAAGNRRFYSRFSEVKSVNALKEQKARSDKDQRRIYEKPDLRRAGAVRFCLAVYCIPLPERKHI